MKKMSNTTIRIIKTEVQNTTSQESNMVAGSALCSLEKKLNCEQMSRLLNISRVG